jgi:hypothetical protein
MDNSDISTLNMLSAIKLFASSAAEREAAAEMIPEGCYREPLREELSWADHPFHLLELYKHSDSPAAKWIDQLVGNEAEDYPAPTPEPRPSEAPVETNPIKPVETEAEPINEVLKKMAQPEIVERDSAPQPKWTKAMPSSHLDLGEKEPLY